MKFTRMTLAECPASAEAVIVIDVCRAFTTAAFALAGGAQKIVLVETTAEAFDLRARHPEWLLVGEENGLPIEGFDHWNSPHDMKDLDFTDKTLVLRTTSGTKGVVRNRDARILLAGSFVVAQATAAYLKLSKPETVAFILTGVKPDRSGVEDIACADYIQALVVEQGPPVRPYLEKAAMWEPQQISVDGGILRHLQKDLQCCLQANHFDFPLLVEREEVYPVLSLKE